MTREEQIRTEGFPEPLTAKEVIILVDEGIPCNTANFKWYRADSTHPDAIEAKNERNLVFAEILSGVIAPNAMKKHRESMPHPEPIIYNPYEEAEDARRIDEGEL